MTNLTNIGVAKTAIRKLTLDQPADGANADLESKRPRRDGVEQDVNVTERVPGRRISCNIKNEIVEAVGVSWRSVEGKEVKQFLMDTHTKLNHDILEYAAILTQYSLKINENNYILNNSEHFLKILEQNAFRELSIDIKCKLLFNEFKNMKGNLDTWASYKYAQGHQSEYETLDEMRYLEGALYRLLRVAEKPDSSNNCAHHIDNLMEVIQLFLVLSQKRLRNAATEVDVEIYLWFGLTCLQGTALSAHSLASFYNSRLSHVSSVNLITGETDASYTKPTEPEQETNFAKKMFSFASQVWKISVTLISEMPSKGEFLRRVWCVHF